MKEDLKYLIALNQFPKFGPIRLNKLLAGCSSWLAAWQASSKQLSRCGLDDNLITEWLDFKKDIQLDKLLEQLTKENVDVVTLDDENYPTLLKQIYNPPPLLYYQGQLTPTATKYTLAVVGARKYTAYGERVVNHLIKPLVESGLTIVSGLALGIDALAHWETVRASGQAIAVLGSGLAKNNIYPATNQALAQKIVATGGALISEFPLNSPALPHHFPQRNRLISGLSLGTLVIEAAAKSGSLITANCALEQNREVLAVPGSVFSPFSSGTNELIKQGAKVVNCAEDVLTALDLNKICEHREAQKVLPTNGLEQKIFDQLDYEPKHTNQLAIELKLDISQINSTLLIMEMKGIVKNTGNMQYVKI